MSTFKKTALTGAETFWYVIMNIAFASGYFLKIPAKKAMADYGLTQLTGAESFWYVIQNICFGAGYFAKIPTAKALSELPEVRKIAQQHIERASLAGPEFPPAPPEQPAA